MTAAGSTTTPVTASDTGRAVGGPTFSKPFPDLPSALSEAAGWWQVAGHLPVPALLHAPRPGDGPHRQPANAGRSPAHTLVYEDVFVGRRCQSLLGDLITAADTDPAPTAVHNVVAAIDAVCDSFTAALSATGEIARLEECVPALYADRIRPGGRIATWYLRDRLTIPDPRTGNPVDVREPRELVVNGTVHRWDLAGAIDAARRALRPGGRWATALTQGDPTEPNIAFGSPKTLCWLDFEHAGRNILAGEIATLLWYLVGMGGWLVPLYRPAVYARTLHRSPRPTPPTAQDVTIASNGRWLRIRCTWPVGAGRAAALARWRASPNGSATASPPTPAFTPTTGSPTSATCWPSGSSASSRPANWPTATCSSCWPDSPKPRTPKPCTGSRHLTMPDPAPRRPFTAGGPPPHPPRRSGDRARPA
ncbi:hypothetical protein [Actinomadura rayongensis]|uniref:Uncharacterized protein n=1 Tax=Actinomadura rayongensis TaxID=1429076 RepID=A0A6I4WHJ6_9ACTN|nr:hypothetical protein [Actinomadura rayongensis]MXQ68353.1 hypothetical protein [Actinomadura rayongensis]